MVVEVSSTETEPNSSEPEPAPLVIFKAKVLLALSPELMPLEREVCSLVSPWHSLKVSKSLKSLMGKLCANFL